MNLASIVQNEMNKQLKRIETCLHALSEEQIWHRLKPNMNSIGNLCMHLAGNEYQHFVSGIGGRPFLRARSEEFTTDNGMSRDELLQRLNDVRVQSSQILENIAESSLENVICIHYTLEDWNSMVIRPNFETEANYSKSIQTILIQVCEHYSYHTGQIVTLTKILSDHQHNITGTYH